jgi:hypothetical protein
VLANCAPNEPAIDFFKPGFFGPGTRSVVLFANSDSMVAGDSLTTTNLSLVFNAFETFTPTRRRRVGAAERPA